MVEKVFINRGLFDNKTKTQVFETFLLQPFLALILVTISSAILGVFVLWKKLSYFGDALSHAILLGLIIGALFGVSQILALIFFAIIFAFSVTKISQNHFFSRSTIVMIFSYFCIALAIILNDVLVKNFDFTSYIFGDVLTVGILDIKALLLITIAIIFYSLVAFRKNLLININEDLARIENIKIEFWNLIFLILLSLTIALSVRIVGVFLMTALLILPAATARIFSLSGKQMLVISLVNGVSVSAFSFMVANHFDLSISPTIIITFCSIFFVSLFLKTCRIHEKF